jgi:hypothetical protein
MFSEKSKMAWFFLFYCYVAVRHYISIVKNVNELSLPCKHLFKNSSILMSMIDSFVLCRRWSFSIVSALKTFEQSYFFFVLLEGTFRIELATWTL